ncbi:MAG: 50S ribosomal protein L24 [Ignavibacteriae bacterium]|nr:50S ribosomal protein L24 [Ignavibacteriota bacterium]MCB9242769.1 50S ribosomal protein L24 [Ignavibacteriales bacterium]
MATKTRLKKGDNVMVVSGNYKGTSGKILFINREKGRVIVEGVNIMHRHTKPNQKNPQGGIVRREAPINISNIMLICPKTNEPTRIGMEVITDEATGKQKRMRTSKNSGEILLS